MRSQKRSQVERAFNKGYQAAMHGRSWSHCPYAAETSRHTWLSGWREGREDHWSGLNNLARLQKLNNL